MEITHNSYHSVCGLVLRQIQYRQLLSKYRHFSLMIINCLYLYTFHSKPIPAMNKHDLKALVASDEIQKTLDILLENTSIIGQSLHDDVIHLASRFTGYRHQKNSGTVSHEQLELTLNHIRAALNDLISRLPNSEFSVSSVTTIISPMSTNGTKDNHSLKSSISWIVGLALLVGITMLLVFVPCPTNAQFFAFRISLALAAGGLATLLPGMFNFNLNSNVKAVGSMGFAVMVYLVNPTLFVAGGRCADTQPFNFTVRLQTQNLPDYPPLKGGNLKIWVADDYKKPELNSDMVAVVKGIAVTEEGKRVDAYLENAAHWKLSVDSVVLSNVSQTLLAIPDGSLAEVSGKVKSSKEGIPVEDVEVEIEGMKDTTDERGNFSLSILLTHQKGEYSLSATPLKKDFQPLIKKVYAGKNIDIRLINGLKK